MKTNNVDSMYFKTKKYHLSTVVMCPKIMGLGDWNAKYMEGPMGLYDTRQITEHLATVLGKLNISFMFI